MTERKKIPRPLPPADTPCPVIDAYKKDVDRTLLRERLKLTPQERSGRFQMAMRTIFELKKAAAQRRKRT